MVLSKRERLISILALAAVAALAVNYLALSDTSPLRQPFTALSSRQIRG